MKKETHCTTGGVEPLREEAGMVYSRKLYIVAYTGVYQILSGQAQDRYHGQKVYSEKGLSRRGRFCTMTAPQVNGPIGKDLSDENVYWLWMLHCMQYCPERWAKPPLHIRFTGFRRWLMSPGVYPVSGFPRFTTNLWALCPDR